MSRAAARSVALVFETTRPVRRPDLCWQPSLLDAGAPRVDISYAGLRRLRLDAACWVDHCPGWLAGSDVVFDELLSAAQWQARDVVMWGTLLPEPRLTARWRDRELPPVLEQVRAALDERYAVGFDSVGVNLYRDGRDSVAWHGDRVGTRLRDPLVATVTLGARRRFVLRPRAGGATRGLEPGPGDLVVMGGSCQHDWEHAVPKTAAAGPRMAITVRHLRQSPRPPGPGLGPVGRGRGEA